MQRDIRGDTTGKARAELIEAVMRNAVSCEWRTKFMHIIPDLDDVSSGFVFLFTNRKAIDTLRINLHVSYSHV